MKIEHELIAAIYEAPLKPDGWPNVLTYFAEFANAGAATIALFDFNYSEYHLDLVSQNYVATPLFREEYNRTCMPFDQAAYQAVARVRKRSFSTDYGVLGISPDEREDIIPAVPFLRKHHGVDHRVATRLSLHGAWTDMLSLQYKIGRGPTTEREASYLMPYLVHLANALEVQRTFTGLKRRYQAILSALDCFQLGVCLVTEKSEIAVKNAEAMRILDEFSGVRCGADRKLVLSDEEEARFFAEALERVISNSAGQAHHETPVFLIKDRLRDVPCVVEMLPLRDSVGEFDKGFRGALMIMIDPARTDSISTKGMELLYEFTEAESAVCSLLTQGFQTNEIADERGVHPETVKSQIKTLFDKTHTKNRIQLVHLAHKVNLPIK